MRLRPRQLLRPLPRLATVTTPRRRLARAQRRRRPGRGPARARPRGRSTLGPCTVATGASARRAVGLDQQGSEGLDQLRQAAVGALQALELLHQRHRRLPVEAARLARREHGDRSTPLLQPPGRDRLLEHAGQSTNSRSVRPPVCGRSSARGGRRPSDFHHGALPNHQGLSFSQVFPFRSARCPWRPQRADRPGDRTRQRCCSKPGATLCQAPLRTLAAGEARGPVGAALLSLGGSRPPAPCLTFAAGAPLSGLRPPTLTVAPVPLDGKPPRATRRSERSSK